MAGRLGVCWSKTPIRSLRRLITVHECKQGQCCGKKAHLDRFSSSDPVKFL